MSLGLAKTMNRLGFLAFFCYSQRCLLITRLKVRFLRGALALPMTEGFAFHTVTLCAHRSVFSAV